LGSIGSKIFPDSSPTALASYLQVSKGNKGGSDRVSCHVRFYTEGKDKNDNPLSQGVLNGDACTLIRYLVGEGVKVP
jgi:hypothetical protein